MIKVNYDKTTGKILGYYADDIDYPVIPEPYIEITFQERLNLLNTAGQEAFVDLSGLTESDEILETEVEEPELYSEINKETGESEFKTRTITRTISEPVKVKHTETVKHYHGNIVLRDKVYTVEEIQEQQKNQENANKSRRIRYIDAYRKYQAAVNYGQYEKVDEVDIFINTLLAKDWTVLNKVPTALRYFLGEIGFEMSGLRQKNNLGIN